MPLPRPLTRPLAVVLLVALAACSGPAGPTRAPDLSSARATPCGGVAAAIVDAIQVYVDSFAGIDATDVPAAATGRSNDLGRAAVRLRADAEKQGCSGTDLAGLVRAELGRLKGGTPVQDAVAATFTADPLGTLDPSDAGRSEVEVATASQLVEALARAGTGSIIRLAAGTFTLDAPLVVLRPIVLVGAGAEATTITSAAAGATLIVASGGDVGLRDLAVTHTGERGASVVMVTDGGYDLSGVRVSGARTENGAGGFGLLLRPTQNALDDSQPRTQRLSHVTATDNTGGGLVVAGRQAPLIESVTVSGTPGCALCFVEDATGTVTGATISGVGIGVRIDHRAAPELRSVTTSRTQVGLALTGSGAVRVTDADLSGGAIGVQATGSGSLTVGQARVRDTTELGFRLSGTTTTTLDAVTVAGAVPVGIAVVAQARLQVTGGAVQTSGDAGLVWGEQATGAVTGLAISGQRLGLQLSDAVRVDLTDVTVTTREAALLATGTSTGAVRGLRCGGLPVILQERTTLDLTSSPTCSTVRE